jgi:prepilin-type N-terminal cleavage/methylation domain-containing protein
LKRAFTLIELLVVIAIIAILAAILFPVFAQAKVMAKKASDLSNNKQINLSTIMYGSDNDDLYPFQSGANNAGVWGWNPTSNAAGYQILIPYNWSALSNTSNQYLWSQGSVYNTVQPYAKNYPIFGSPGGTTDPVGPGVAIPNGYTPTKFTYAYNGYMSGYNSTSIASPTTVPIWTSMLGNGNFNGWAEANPQINCPIAAAPCSYVPNTGSCLTTENGECNQAGSVLISTGLTLWTFNQGQNWAYFDGHAKYRKVAVTASNLTTSYSTEPSAVNSAYGVASPSEIWSDQGLAASGHAYLFRPDYVPSSGYN